MSPRSALSNAKGQSVVPDAEVYPTPVAPHAEVEVEVRGEGGGRLGEVG